MDSVRVDECSAELAIIASNGVNQDARTELGGPNA